MLVAVTTPVAAQTAKPIFLDCYVNQIGSEPDKGDRKTSGMIYYKIDIQKLLGIFQEIYNVEYTEGLELVTIRHYDQQTIDRVTVNKSILLEQKTRQTARLVMRDLG